MGSDSTKNMSVSFHNPFDGKQYEVKERCEGHRPGLVSPRLIRGVIHSIWNSFQMWLARSVKWVKEEQNAIRMIDRLVRTQDQAKPQNLKTPKASF